jgi:hypothetical protein
VGLYNDERQPLALALFIAVNAKYKLAVEKRQLLARLSAVCLTDTASRKQPTGTPSRLRDEGFNDGDPEPFLQPDPIHHGQS